MKLPLHFSFVLISLGIYWTNGCTPATTAVDRVDLPYSFQHAETKQLSLDAYELRKQGRFEAAIELYKNAQTIEPNNPRLFFDLSETYAKINDFKTAVVMMDSAIRLDNKNAYLYANRGFMYFKMDSTKAALEDLSYAIQLDSTQGFFYSRLALIYEGEKDYPKACECIQKAEQLGITVSKYPELDALQRNCAE